MNSVEVHTNAQEYVIHIQKNAVNTQLLNDFLERVKIEALANKIGFDDEVLEIGEEINKNWWQQNKSRFIKDESEDNH